MQDVAEGEAPRLHAVRIGLWQAAATALLVVLSVVSGRGSRAGIIGGAVLFYASLALQSWSFGIALRGRRRPGFALAVFLLKLTVLLVVALVGLKTKLLAPMSFAAGASTLLLAIVADTCYGTRSASSPRSPGR